MSLNTGHPLEQKIWRIFLIINERTVKYKTHQHIYKPFMPIVHYGHSSWAMQAAREQASKQALLLTKGIKSTWKIVTQLHHDHHQLISLCTIWPPLSPIS